MQASASTRPSLDEVIASVTAELLQELSVLHSGAHCLLLMDNSLRPVDTADAAWERYAKGPVCAIRVAHSDVGSMRRPTLLALDPGIDADAALLRHTVREACFEATPEQLRMGRGRRIGGWLVSRAPIDDVAAHLGRMMVQRHPSGRAVWLRLQDPGVTWAVSTLIAPRQRAALLGPIHRAYLLTPVGELLALAIHQPDLDGDLRLNLEQWTGIECIEAINTAWREWGRLERPDQLDEAFETTYRAVRRARRMGFRDPADLSFYGRCALAVHPNFDSHAELAARLYNRQAGDSFTRLVADLGPAAWRRIANELASPERAACAVQSVDLLP